MKYNLHYGDVPRSVLAAYGVTDIQSFSFTNVKKKKKKKKTDDKCSLKFGAERVNIFISINCTQDLLMRSIL